MNKITNSENNFLKMKGSVPHLQNGDLDTIVRKITPMRSADVENAIEN